ncbi:MAG: hypothetical protein ABIC91_08335 [Nanoarchaeota archaeon]|nr:hypothetical protein [Nanoarchaeota archaeon]MBU1030958.1 hypothetical protein [Nanoarchaeota archaeon]MBU1849883.1 hypothetical protein [Nanoarchaeota archaeon]
MTDISDNLSQEELTAYSDSLKKERDKYSISGLRTFLCAVPLSLGVTSLIFSGAPVLAVGLFFGGGIYMIGRIGYHFGKEETFQKKVEDFHKHYKF